MTRGQRQDGPRLEIQDGAATPSAQRARGGDRGKETVSKAPKKNKEGSGDPPKDMRYYAQKLTGKPPETSAQPMDDCAPHSDTEMEEGENVQGAGAILDHTESNAGLQWDTEEPEVEGGDQPTLAAILKAVNKCTASVNGLRLRFGSLEEEVGLIRHDIQKMRERTTAVEGRISDLEDRMPPLIRETQNTSRLARAVDMRAEDFENRLRRNNVRIVGLPEKVEGRDPTQFVEQWMAEVFGKDSFTHLYAVERAHRVPTRPLPPGNPPRPILARLLNYRDREIILRLAREKKNVQFNGTRVSFYPDFSAAVQKSRARFTEIKKRLQKVQAPYAMLYPARLRVILNGQAHFFEHPADASDWLDANEGALRQVRRPRVEED